MKQSTFRTVCHRHYGRVALLTLLIISIGCGRSSQAKVSGRVLLDGKPLPGGTLKFRPVDGRANLVTVELDESAAFSVELPVGEVMVAVDNRSLEPKSAVAPGPRPVPQGVNPEVRAKLKLDAPKSPPRPPTNSARYVAIPSKYYSAEASGLGFTVEPGETSHDIGLKSQ